MEDPPYPSRSTFHRGSAVSSSSAATAETFVRCLRAERGAPRRPNPNRSDESSPTPFLQARNVPPLEESRALPDAVEGVDPAGQDQDEPVASGGADDAPRLQRLDQRRLGDQLSVAG